MIDGPLRRSVAVDIKRPIGLASHLPERVRPGASLGLGKGPVDAPLFVMSFSANLCVPLRLCG